MWLQGREFNAPGPAPRHTPIEELARSAQQLLDIFASNGYALKVLPAAVGNCSAMQANHETLHDLCP